jgi:hypothetical protein
VFRRPQETGKNLPLVNPQTIPESWRRTPLKLTTDHEVTIYRGFPRNAQRRIRDRMVMKPDEDTGGIFSRRLDAAHDAIFNYVSRNPTLSGPDAGGVVAVHLSREVWNLLVRQNGISEREYPGFSRRLKSTETRVNSPEAGELINNGRMTLLPPDNRYDYRGRP